ncbi:MAG: WD40/YVTN/BNR-like repeat-containing protein [Hormoscilla sp.]
MKKHPLIHKYVIVLLLMVAIALFLGGESAMAHRPHDRIDQVEVSGNYSQDQTLFILVRGNLFKSTDGGSSWLRVVRGLDNKSNLSSLAIAGQGYENMFLSSLGDGIYKSRDGGESWQKVNKGLETLSIDLLSIASETPEVVLAAGHKQGLYQTKNGGETWSQVLAGKSKITAIAFMGSADQMMVGDNEGKLYVSEDGGAVWQEKSGMSEKNGGITAIAVSPQNERRIFVGTEKGGIWQTIDGGKSFASANNGLSDKLVRDVVILPGKENNLLAVTWHEGVFQSNDGGKSWSKRSGGLTKDKQADEFKTFHFQEVKIGGQFGQSQTLFLAGFNGLFKSTDGGGVWQELDTLSHRTIVSLGISPAYGEDGTIAIADYVGRVRTSKDGGETWTAKNKGLEVPLFTKNFTKPYQDPRRFFDVAFSPTYAEDKTIFATLLWNNFLRSTDGGTNWEIIDLKKVKGYATRGMTIATSPNYAEDRTIYLGTIQGVIYRSKNGGKKFSVVGKIEKRKTNLPLGLVISPDFANDQTLYVSGWEGVYKTVDGGKTWQAIAEGTALADRKNIKLAISPNYQQDRTVLVGTENGMFATEDAGKTWEKLPGAAYGGDGYIEGVAISPNYQSDRTFIITVKGRGLFKTVDAGKSFTQIGDGSISLSRMTSVPSASAPIQFSPAYASDRTIYGLGAAEAELFKSTDGGNNWSKIAILETETDQYNLPTRLAIVYSMYQKHFNKLIVAAIMGLVSYVTISFLPLERKLPGRKSQIKTVAAIAIFVMALIILPA